MSDPPEPARPDGRPIPGDREASVQVQLERVRTRLLRDALAMELDEIEIIEAIEHHAKGYSTARVHLFVGVLVERAVRQELSIRTVLR